MILDIYIRKNLTSIFINVFQNLVNLQLNLVKRGLVFYCKFNLHLAQSFFRDPIKCINIVIDGNKLKTFNNAISHEPLSMLIRNSNRLQKRIDVIRKKGVEQENFLYTIDEAVYIAAKILKVRGWAISNYGASTIELYNGNHLLAADAINGSRPDVSMAYPDKIYNRNTGFELLFEIDELSTENLRIRILDNLNFFTDVKIESIQKKQNEEIFDFELNYNLYLAKEKLEFQNIIKSRDVLKFDYKPLISIVIPTYNIDKKWLFLAVKSVIDQVYNNWELCIYDDGSTSAVTHKALNEIKALEDPRIKIRRGIINQGISLASNNAISMCNGEYIGLLDHDDMLAPSALYEVVKVLNEHKYDFIYSDEDKIDEGGNRFSPHFKSNFNIFLLRCQNYICHFSIIKKSIGDKLGWFQKGFEGAQDHDLFLRIVELTKNIFHIDKILYHWRTLPSSTSYNIDTKEYFCNSGNKAISDHINRTNINATVSPSKWKGAYNINYIPRDEASLTIVIPFKDEQKLLESCINSIVDNTTYSNYSILLVNNNSQSGIKAYLDLITNKFDHIKVVDYSLEFNFSAINNFAINMIESEYVLLLNNDIEVITKGWLSQMVGLLEQSSVGAVGAKLLYPDLTIQHAGVILGIGGVAGHSHKYLDNESNGYFLRPHLDQCLSACTGACLLFETQVYNEIGGLDESNLKVAFNDIDFCLRLLDKKFQIVYSASSVLIHHESKSRGRDDQSDEKFKRFISEVNYMKNIYPNLEEDSFYNKNLTLDCENFGIKSQF